MWHTYELLARDVIRDRQRDAAATALGRRATRDATARDGGAGHARRVSSRVGAPRRALAAILRGIEARSVALAAVTHRMAARVEDRAEKRVA